MITNVTEVFNIACNNGNAIHLVKLQYRDTLQDIDAQIDNFEFSQYSNSERNISIGTACAAQVKFEINGDAPDLLAKYINVLVGVLIDDTDTFEWIVYGTYKVFEQTFNAGVTRFLAYDDMCAKLENEYISTLPFPTTDRAMINEIASAVSLDVVYPSDFTQHTINEFQKKYTYRETLGYLASLQGKNVIIDERNTIKFVFANETDYEIDDNRIYIDKLSHEEREEYEINYLAVETVVDNEETTLYAGNTSALTGVEINNPYVVTQDIVNNIYYKITNIPRIVPFSIEMLGDIRLQVGDIVKISSKGKEFDGIIMHIVHTIDGGIVSKVECFASNTANLVDPVTRALNRQKSNILDTRKQIVETDKTIFDYQQVANNMTSLISQGFGMYATQIKQADGSVKNYLHDAPDINRSLVIWELTNNGLLVSKDGGTSWAVDSNGNALLNVITAKGIEAEWLKVAQQNTEYYVTEGVGRELYDLQATVETLQNQVDGNVKIYTSKDVPTLDNYPFVEWYDKIYPAYDDETAEDYHFPSDTTWTYSSENLRNYIGSIVYVEGSANSYKFIVDGENNFSWLLLSDSETAYILNRVSALEANVDGLTSRVSQTELQVGNKVDIVTFESTIEQTDREINSKVSKTDYNGEEIVSQINQTAEQVKIQAKNINLNGVVTANNNVKINTDGTLEAKNGVFSGTVNATNGSFTGTVNSSNGKIGNFNISTKLSASKSGYMNPTIKDFNTIKDAVQKGTGASLYAKNKWWDLTGDGKVDVYDYGYMRRMIIQPDYNYSDATNKTTTTVTVVVNPDDVKKMIRVYGTNAWGSTIDNYFGIDGVKTNKNVSETVITQSLTIGGTTLDEDQLKKLLALIN